MDIIDSFKEPWSGGKYVVIFSDKCWFDIEQWCINEFRASVKWEWKDTDVARERISTVKFRRANQLSWFMLRWA